MSPLQPHIKNPRRVVAGKLNRAKRKGLTAAGRRRLREGALKHKPWRFAAGPRTPAGKAKMAENGKKRQLGPRSVREVRKDLAELRDFLKGVKEYRKLVNGC
jgi:hypothetical protein